MKNKNQHSYSLLFFSSKHFQSIKNRYYFFETFHLSCIIIAAIIFHLKIFHKHNQTLENKNTALLEYLF